MAAAATDISTGLVSSQHGVAGYARPLSDYTAGRIYVIEFVPTGTALADVTDWGPIWNAAIDYCRELNSQGITFRLEGPQLRQAVATTVNLADFQSFGGRIDFNNAQFIGQTKGKAVFDAMGSRFLQLHGGPNIVGDIDNLPTVGFQIGRTDMMANQNADTIHFDGIFLTGCFSFCAFYNNNSESCSFINYWFSNACPIDLATGVVTVAGVPTGEPNVCYSLVTDGLNHWNLYTLAAGGQKQPTGAAESPQSFNQSSYLRGDVGSDPGSGPAMWLSHSTNHKFYDCYINSGSSLSLVDIYRTTNDDFNSVDFDVHCEFAGATYDALFRILGPTTICYTTGIRFRDAGAFMANVFFRNATETQTMIRMTDVDIMVGKMVGIGTTPTFFDRPELYQTEGSISVPAGQWNGVVGNGDHGHTGRLSVGGVSSYVGQVKWCGSIDSAALAAALAELGMAPATRSIGSLSMQAGIWYCPPPGNPPLLPVIRIAQPPSGETAAAVFEGFTTYGGNVMEGGSGYTDGVIENLYGSDGSLLGQVGVHVTDGRVTGIYPPADGLPGSLAMPSSGFPAEPWYVGTPQGPARLQDGITIVPVEVRLVNAGTGYVSLPLVEVSPAGAPDTIVAAEFQSL